jgi:hypothetical protein
MMQNRQLGSRLPLRRVEKRPCADAPAGAGGGFQDPGMLLNRLHARVFRSVVANHGRRRTAAAGPFYLLGSRGSEVLASDPPVPRHRAPSSRTSVKNLRA